MIGRSRSSRFSLRGQREPSRYAFEAAQARRKVVRHTLGKMPPSGPSLGPILWQLPPSFPKNTERLTHFLNNSLAGCLMPLNFGTQLGWRTV